MKPCGYCGRENESEALYCFECGTSLADNAAEPPSSVARPPGSLRKSMLIVLGIFVALCFYLLSLGPVTRLCATQTSTPAVVAPGGGITLTVTTTYPAPVYLIYYPVFQLLSVNANNGFLDAYRRYLEWWERKPEP